MSVQEAFDTSPATARVRQRHNLGVALLTIAAAQFLIVMDATVVTVGLPNIGEALGMQPANLAWLLTGYALAFGGLLLTGGRIADMLGARATYRAGLVMLTVTSLAGGLATSGTVLIAARIGQGVAAALIAPAALSLLTATFPAGPARTKALGVFGATSGLGPVVGLLLGGVLTEYASWRWVLLVNIPLALATLGGTRALPEGTRARGRIDLPGAVTASLGIGALVYAVSQAPRHGWTDHYVVASGLVATALLAAFAIVQRRSRTPMLPATVLADRGRSGAYLVMFLMGAGMLATYYFLTLYMQLVKGYAPLRTGLVYLPMALATVLGSGLVAPTLLQRFSVRTATILGLGLAAASMIWFAQLTAGQDPWVVLIPAQVVSGIGVGIGFVTLTAAGVQGVEIKDTGIASGVLNTATQIGGALGLAVLVTIATATTRGQPLDTPLETARTSGYTAGFIAGGVLFLAAIVTAALTLNNQVNPKTSKNNQKGTDMPVTRTHHYAVDPADLEELIAQRADLIATIRASCPGLAETRLTRLEDGTYTDVWCWDSPEQMRAAFAAAPTIPAVRLVMSLTRDATALNGEILDQR